MIGKSSKGISRLLMRFPEIDFSALEGVTVTYAAVSLRDLMCEEAEMPITCYPFTGSAWTESTADWSVTTQSWGDALSTHIISYDSGEAQPSSFRYFFEITSLAQQWVDGTMDEDKGVILRSTDAVENSETLLYKTFASYERASYKPTFTITYTTVTVTPDTTEIYQGDTIDLSAATDPDGLAVTWSSENNAIATVDENGVVTGISAGETTITASVDENTYAVCYVSVLPKSIAISEDSYEVRVDGTASISVSTIPEGQSITWSSSDPDILSHLSGGNFAAKKAGTVTVTATLADGTSDTCTVRVVLKDGVYYIQNLHSELYLHVHNGGITNFTDVCQHSKYLSTINVDIIRQMWKICYLGEGRYSVRPMHKPDMGLDVTGSNVDIYKIGTDDTLSGVPSYGEWTISWDSTGYVFQNNGLDSKTMQIENASTSSGATVVASTYSTSENCQWGLTRVTTPPSGAYWFDTNTESVVSGNPTDEKYIIYGSTYDIDDLGLVAIAYSPISNYQTFTWSSSNAAIATIDSSTGAIVGKNSGEVQITAKRYINGNYQTLTFDLIVIGADQYSAGVRIATIDGKQYYDFTIPVNKLFEDAVALCEDHRCMNWTQYCTWVYDRSIFDQPSLSEHASLQLNSFLWFYQQVNHGAVWDIKLETQWKAALPGLPYLIDEDGKFGDFVFRGAVTTAEGLGNIMYGYTGRATGFGEVTLYWGGGVAAQGSVNSDEVTQPPYYGDSEEDHFNIEKGFDMFNEDYPDYPDIGYDGIPLDGWIADIADVILNPGT